MRYDGESGGALYARLLKAVLAPKSEQRIDAFLQRLLEGHDHKCAGCDEPVTERNYGVHRTSRLCRGAGEDANTHAKQATLCKCCQHRYTEAKQLAFGSGPTVTNQLHVCPRAKHLPVCTPMRQPVVWDQYTAFRNTSRER